MKFNYSSFNIVPSFKNLVGLLSLTILLGLSACSDTMPAEIKEASTSIPDKIDYNFHVKPILSDRCYTCHGPDENQLKANLRLDLESQIFKTTEGGSSNWSKVVNKGRPLKSELTHRILSDDSKIMMPPPESHLELNAEEKAILIKWIDQGAAYKKHWSFIPPLKKDAPNGNSDWGNNEIDQYIAPTLKQNGLNPAEPATPEELFRRMYMDITGLPPSVAEMDAYLASDDPSIYEKTIDRLLDSEHYGEHMAVAWLDVARYADTHGYQDDGLRTVWPYRDWVIKAFNENKPYDEFLTEQLAGDLLENPTTDQLIATCFNRNHPQTQEGGIIDEEYRVEYVADRTNTFGKAMLGLSMECARCHDHKYDPISQKDYYSLYAYFNNNNESGIVPYVGEASPTVIIPTPEESKRLDSIRAEIGIVAEDLVSDNYIEEFKSWLAKEPIVEVSRKKLLAEFDLDEIVEVPRNSLNLDGKKSPGWAGIGAKGMIHSMVNKVKGIKDAALLGDKDRLPRIVNGHKGNGLEFYGDAGFRFNRDMDLDRNEEITVSIWLKITAETASGPIFNNTNGNFEGYRGWLAKLNKDKTLTVQLNHVWPDNAIDCQTAEPLPLDEWLHLVMTYDGTSKAEGVKIYINGDEPEVIVHTDNLNKSILNGQDGKNWSSMPFIIGKELTQSIQDVTMDELLVYNRKLSDIEVRKLFDSNYVPNDSEEEWLDYYLSSGLNSTYSRKNEELIGLRGIENEIVTNVNEVMTMREREEKRKTYILGRGAYDVHEEEVSANVPALLDSDDNSFAKDRLGLSKWLVDRENPLTSRVVVNRLWSSIFGKGLVNTIDDFGNQGSLPDYPELLDYLAVDFVDNGWDVKRLVKNVLLSHTYQQSAYGDAVSEQKDPVNRWYSRFPAHRLKAEQIRDRALAGSGLMVKQIGGPSVYPYQPNGLWKELATRNETVYKVGEGDDLYRRSMYTIWKRSSPPPSMMSFDATDRYFCQVNRQNTSTPLQSLVLFNDPQYLEAAKMMVYKSLMDVGGDEDERLTYIFKSLINRKPTTEEYSILKELVIEEKDNFSNAPHRIEALLNVGEKQLDQQYYTAEYASLMIAASTIMNYNEFVLKT